MEDNRSASFIRQNLELLGFSDENEAFTTTLMELIDNSIDAVIQNTSISVEEREIELSVTLSSKGYCVQIVDNGNSLFAF